MNNKLILIIIALSMFGSVRSVAAEEGVDLVGAYTESMEQEQLISSTDANTGNAAWDGGVSATECSQDTCDVLATEKHKAVIGVIPEIPYSTTRYGALQSAGYISVGGKAKQLFQKPAYFASLHSGWIINDRYYFGAAIYGLLHPDVVLEFSGQSVDINMVYAGMENGMIFHLMDWLKLRPQLLLGFTSMFYKAENSFGDNSMTGNDTLVMEPSVYIDAQVMNMLMVSFGVGYHFSLGAEFVEGIKNQDVNSPTIEFLISWIGW